MSSKFFHGCSVFTISPPAIRGDYNHAYRYGNLALQIFDTHEAEEWHARVGGSVYGGVYPMKHPYRLSLQPLLAAHRSGLVLGDVHVSFILSIPTTEVRQH